ncbi:MAG: hypothetical protein ACFFDY_00070 [Candidatus Thorarchaeota archaeon]
MNYKFGDNKYKLINDDGEVLASMKEVAIVFDKKHSCLLRHGELKLVEKYYNDTMYKYRKNNLSDIANDLAMIWGKLDIEELNKIIQITNYIGIFYKKKQKF